MFGVRPPFNRKVRPLTGRLFAPKSSVPLRRSLLGFLALLCSIITGCDKGALTLFTADDLQVARRAMSINEVSLMVRSGYDQKTIIAEVEQRHVSALIDAKTEESLIRFGAKPSLIATLKNEANVLTPGQKRAFNTLAAERKTAAEDGRDMTALATRQQNEKLVNAVPVSQRVVNSSNGDTPEEAYWKAEAAYRAKKTQLEGQIASQQSYINYLRSRGYYQSDLASAENRLEQYEQELKNLKNPIR